MRSSDLLLYCRFLHGHKTDLRRFVFFSTTMMAQSNNNSSSLRLLQFLVLAAVYRSSLSVEAFTTTTAPAPATFTTAGRQRYSTRSVPLFAIAEYPSKEDEKTNSNNNNNNDWGRNDGDDDEDMDHNDAWVETEGGFLPKIPGLLRDKITKRRTIPEEVLTIQEYKAVVADEKDQMVVVRFYAPWCKACKAVQQPFRKLCRENPNIKFVECPLTKENAYLHEGLGVPSLPYGHIYHPRAGLVEERKIKKAEFAEFSQVLQTYVDGRCHVEYVDGGACQRKAYK